METNIITTAANEINTIAKEHDLDVQNFSIESSWAPRGSVAHIAKAMAVATDDQSRSPEGYVITVTLHNGECSDFDVSTEREFYN